MMKSTLYRKIINTDPHEFLYLLETSFEENRQFYLIKDLLPFLGILCKMDDSCHDDFSVVLTITKTIKKMKKYMLREYMNPITYLKSIQNINLFCPSARTYLITPRCYANVKSILPFNV